MGRCIDVFAGGLGSVVSVPDSGRLESTADSDTSIESFVNIEPATALLSSLPVSLSESMSMLMSSPLADVGCFSSMLSMLLLCLGSVRGVFGFFGLMSDKSESLGGEHEGEEEEEEEEEEDDPPLIPEWTKWSLSA